MTKHKSAKEELADPKYLDVIWKSFYRDTPKPKRKSSGIDGISFLDFKARKIELLQDISHELLNKKIGNKVKSYQHSSLAVFPQIKPNGIQYRIICIPTIKDRLIQKAILRLLESRGYRYETKISYGYSKKRSVTKALQNAIKLRTEKNWIYKTDIKSFFDKIPRKEMKKVVAKKIRFKSLHPIIFQAIDAEITSNLDKDTKIIIKKENIVIGKGLRQGLPLSPLLSNLCLEKFDINLHASGFSAIRYADELIIFCHSKIQCLEAHEFCVNELKKYGLNIDPVTKNSKTKIYKPSDTAEFLGLGIACLNGLYKLIITDSQIERIWNKFELLRDIEKNIENNIKFVNLYHRLESIVDSYKGHYGEAENYFDFEENLYKWRRNIYRSIFGDQYQIDIENLSYKKKHFLHLLD